MKQLLIFLFLLCSMSISAQDVIVKKDGSTIVCRVIELTSSEITYKKWSDLNGSNYVMNRADASAINYENGKKVNLSEPTNLYTPNNQNEGVQQYNDKALLEIDKAISLPYKKSKKQTATAWIGGGAFLAAGVAFYLVYSGSKEEKTYDDYWYEQEWALPVSIACIGGAVTWTTYFLILANKNKKFVDNQMYSAPVYQYKTDFSNGSSLLTGIDLIGNNLSNYKTLGFGIRYNF